jgi:hypothetical protein
MRDKRMPAPYSVRHWHADTEDVDWIWNDFSYLENDKQ